LLTKKDMIKNKLFRSEVEVIKLRDSYLILSKEWPITIGDDVINIDSYENGHGDVEWKCEDADTELHMNQPNTSYRKVIWTSDRVSYLFNDGPPHDHNYDYPGGFIEPMLKDNFERIIESEGICQVEAEIDEFGITVGPKLAFGDGIVFYTPIL